MKKNKNCFVYTFIFIILSSVLFIYLLSLFTNKKEYFTQSPETEEEPTEEPTESPTEEPTESPTEEPTESPTEEPEEELTEEQQKDIERQIQQMSKTSPQDLDVIFSHLPAKRLNQIAVSIKPHMLKITPEQKALIQPQLDVILKYIK